jgi:diacylglycerol kinase family enzyme
LLLRTNGPHGDVALRRAGTRVRVDAFPPQPIQIDGDVHGVGWLDATVVPGALTLLVPTRAV